MSVRRPGSMLTPPRNGLELGQRIIVFWQTYLLDKVNCYFEAIRLCLLPVLMGRRSFVVGECSD